MLRLLLVITVGISGAFAVAACNDDDDDDDGGATTPAASATAAPVTSPTAAATSATDADAEAALDAYIIVLQTRSRDRLRDFTGDQLRQRLQDQDLDRLTACIPDGATVSVVDRSVTISGDTATVTATLELTLADGTTQEAEHVVTFVKDADGTWRLAEIPTCPFQ